MSQNRADVVIAGGGPNGLMLACELALGGVQPVVLERLRAPSDEIKANGLVGQVVRALDIRGLYHEFSGDPQPPRALDGWMFAGIPVRFLGVPDNPMYTLPIPQPRLVALLERRAHTLGVDIRWGHELTGIAGSDGELELTVTAEGKVYEIGATYLVGADGGRSFVRKSAGIDFPGVTTLTVSRMADVHVADELRTADGGIHIPGFGPIPLGRPTRTDGGTFVFFDLYGSTWVATAELGTGPSDETPMTLEELRESARRVLGVDLPFEPPRGPGPHRLRRIVGQNTRQADRYRSGNVFLVGDSAHVHSPIGGPGLNLGLQDVMNLGWKLAAAAKGIAPIGLLDTYQSERHPVGERVMMHSLAQLALTLPAPEISGLRDLLEELLQVPGAAEHVAHLLAGSDVRYDVGDNHRLAGRFLPDLTLADGRRVAELLHHARPVLLDLSGGHAVAAAQDWQGRIEALVSAIPDCPLSALLIRPDGYVAWAADAFESGDDIRLRAALRRWFGEGGTSA
ncbi:FAD-dependent monooxygenase [Mycobacterium sp. 1465703.0]|uniref:FAD-dependent monooxygenase n=1 Tax=Mycobacterium sp. 1465703.0 TaxID=1834078 RepID=UPI0007FBC7FD|nr:FAD-dependent monooxygenase [Mycobacterium sp. 1465703.0]OBJ10592.1 FAD-dependent oxidoreductase [Mycobacterium sp. 1465703.0]